MAGIPYPNAVEWARLYRRSAKRSIRKYGFAPQRLLARPDARPVFIVGSCRSGTSFTAESIGSMPGFSELGELAPFKRVIPDLFPRPIDDVARSVRTIIGRSQRLGLVAGLRAVETTPESTFLIPAIVRAYPKARFVHVIRDGRDVAASLIGLGWVGHDPSVGKDDMGRDFGNQARFWIEPGREAEFAAASDATRAAWVWRRYASAAREHLAVLPGQGIEIRYENLLDDPESSARALAAFLGAEDRVDVLIRTIIDTTVHTARGRWRRELNEAQLADIAAEAGPLLRDLGYDD